VRAVLFRITVVRAVLFRLFFVTHGFRFTGRGGVCNDATKGLV
jgi:hypothetical protein